MAITCRCVYILYIVRERNAEHVLFALIVQDACHRFSHQIHIRVFSEILSGELDEEVYDTWISTQAALVEAFKKAAPSGQVGDISTILKATEAL